MKEFTIREINQALEICLGKLGNVITSIYNMSGIM